MAKQDLRKESPRLYAPSSKTFSVVDVPKMTFFMIDGEGNPNTAAAYRDALEALYSASYTLKFMSKNDLGEDYVVPPLEGLWWADDMDAFITREKDAWKWTMMIRIPDWIMSELAKEAIARAAAKKGFAALERLRVEALEEGLCVQILHIGPYDEEGPVLHRLHHEFMPSEGLLHNGLHHEIYLGDPRKAAPEKLKTVLRQPVRSAG